MIIDKLKSKLEIFVFKSFFHETIEKTSKQFNMEAF